MKTFDSTIMTAKLFLFCLYSYLNFKVIAEDSNMCQRIQTYKDHTMEMVVRDVSFSYVGRCEYWRCPKTAVVKRSFYEMVPVIRTRMVDECCEGYVMTEWNNLCEPQCEIDCGPHGHCSSPQKCSCSVGYSWDDDTSKCHPTCASGCANGKCLEPEVCECLMGYTKNSENICEPNCTNCTNGKCSLPEMCVCNEGYSKNETSMMCSPICTKGCAPHGICTLPNTCQCSDGYELNVDNSCVPKCINCSNGYCTAPRICTCNIGFSWNNANELCSPVCTSDCEHGFCVAPNKCKCEEGYQQHQDPENTFNCVPFCKNCKNGKCTAPETCSCDKGYVWDKETLQCNPVCNKGCFVDSCSDPNECEFLDGITLKSHQLNNSYVQTCTHCQDGVCTAPNICSCNAGYSWENATNKCIPVCRSGCSNGICVAPDTCECKSGFEKSADVCAPKCMVPCRTNICTISPYICDDSSVPPTTPTIVSPLDISDCPVCIRKICITKETKLTKQTKCSCSSDYISFNQTHCSPICTDCRNGLCKIPIICECLPGYGKNVSISHQCHPWCVGGNNCLMGICVAPNVCKCNDGFMLSDSDPFSCVFDTQSNQLSLETIGVKSSAIVVVALAFFMILIFCGIGIFVYIKIRRGSIVYTADEQSYIYTNQDSDNE